MENLINESWVFDMQLFVSQNSHVLEDYVVDYAWHFIFFGFQIIIILDWE